MDSLTTGNYNVAIGVAALQSIGDDSNNVAVGYRALYNSTVSNNTAVGRDALYADTTGTENVAVGGNSLYANTTGNDNTALGYQALYTATTALSNTGIGLKALYTVDGNGTTGSNNVAVGRKAGYNMSTGYRNVCVGNNAGERITTGYQNTCVGNIAGYSTGQTGYNNTLLGYNAQCPADGTNNHFILGNSSVDTLACQQTSISGLSDARDKKDIIDCIYGLDVINSVRPRQFTWAMREPSDIDGKIELGFIAQELDEVLGDKNDVIHAVSKTNPDKLFASPGKFVPILVKAVQELSAEVEQLKSQLNN